MGFSGNEAGDDGRAFVLTGLRCRESANVMSKLVVDIAGNVVGERIGNVQHEDCVCAVPKRY